MSYTVEFTNYATRGKRRGAGRKPGIRHLGPESARRLLADLDFENEIKRLYARSGSGTTVSDNEPVVGVCLR
jgi:hypothetical protein